MRRLCIGIDVDDTIAELSEPWINWINTRFGYRLNPKRGFSQWSIEKIPQIADLGDSLFEFLHPSIYDENVVKPIPGAFMALNILRRLGASIRFVTSCVRNTEQAKRSWLLRHGFMQLFNGEFVPMSDKSKAPVDVLVDDGFHNVKSFHGHGILVSRPHNCRFAWHTRIGHLNDLVSPFLMLNHPKKGIVSP
jgi:5'(3')-deoxyribonucleotidase